MTKTVNVVVVCERLDEILDEVRERGNPYVIERDGKPVAAVVPVEQLERAERARKEFFEIVDRIHERNKDVDPEEIERDIEAALEEVRKRRT